MNKNRFNLNDKKTKNLISNTIIILLLIGCIGFGIASLGGGEVVETSGSKVNNKKSEVASKPTNDKKADDKKPEDKPEDKPKEETSSDTEDKGTESSGDTDNTENTANSNTSGDENTNSTTPEPAHTHSWIAVTSNVKHDEVGHFEEILVSEAWTESVPVYKDMEIAVCNGCGADITSDPWGHIESQASLGNFNCGGFHSEWNRIQTGTSTVNHPAVYEKKWVVDTAAWNETVTTGYKCNCGETK